MQTDELHIAILNELQQDARISNAEIGRRVGLTAPAVAERIKRMEEEGIIQGFTVKLNFRQLNYTEKVMIGIKLPHGYINSFLKETEKIEGITSMVRTTGEYCFFITLTLRSIDELDSILTKFGNWGETITYTILATPVDNKPIQLS